MRSENPSPMLVREAREADLPRVAALHEQIHALHVAGRPDIFKPVDDAHRTTFADWLAQPATRVLAAVRGDEVVGYAITREIERPASFYSHPRRYVHVEEICVDEAHRHEGAGRMLSERIRDDARERGFAQVELDVWEFNEDAIRFYERMGFRVYRRFLELDTGAEGLPERGEAPWLRWAMELQSLAQCGLTYCKDVYDIERYERLRTLSAEMLAYQARMPLPRAQALFCNETGYQTPKLDTRAAVFQDGKILLVQERDGLWSMPGGWVDVLETIASNAVKEVREEAGLEVRAERLIALHDKNRRNKPPLAYSICKAFVECSVIGGAFQPNSETVASGWFALDKLPPLATGKTTREQVEMCFRAHADANWRAVFD